MSWPKARKRRKSVVQMMTLLPSAQVTRTPTTVGARFLLQSPADIGEYRVPQWQQEDPGHPNSSCWLLKLLSQRQLSPPRPLHLLLNRPLICRSQPEASTWRVRARSYQVKYQSACPRDLSSAWYKIFTTITKSWVRCGPWNYVYLLFN